MSHAASYLSAALTAFLAAYIFGVAATTPDRLVAVTMYVGSAAYAGIAVTAIRYADGTWPYALAAAFAGVIVASYVWDRIASAQERQAAAAARRNLPPE